MNHPDLLSIVKSVAEECAGLPLAIVTIASSMRGVCNIPLWRNALRELKKQARSSNGMEEKVFQKLQLSYDHLRDEKVKHCFLCCALYPEDCKIGIDELIQLWIAEGLVAEMDSSQMEIDKGYAILNYLKNSCLIEIVVDRFVKNKVKVKLHDVVRDMALRITSVRPRFLVSAGIQLKEIPYVQHWKEDLEKASFMENPGIVIPFEMPLPRCPNLTTLLLSNCHIESIPECFFEQMHGLKILDLSWNKIKSLPNSISNLETLTTLLLGWCCELEKVPSFSKLEALKKLDLEWIDIKDIPDGMEKLINLKYLDLSGTPIREMNDVILTKFTSLQHLKLITSPKVKPGICVRGEVIGGLRKLEIFDGRFHDFNEWNNYAQALQLARKSWPRQYRIFVGPVKKYDNFDSDKWTELNGGGICCTHGIKIPSDVEYLTIRNIIVGLCEEEEALSSSGFVIPVPQNIFSALARIELWECKNIKKLLSSKWVLHNLQNLKYLGVRGCDEMEEIIASKSKMEVEDEEGITSTIPSFQFTALPKLRHFSLWDLPVLKSICGVNGVMICDSIEEIDIKNCPKLKRIPLKLPLQDDGQPSPPPSLRQIRISSKNWPQLELGQMPSL